MWRWWPAPWVERGSGSRHTRGVVDGDISVTRRPGGIVTRSDSHNRGLGRTVSSARSLIAGFTWLTTWWPVRGFARCSIIRTLVVLVVVIVILIDISALPKLGEDAVDEPLLGIKDFLEGIQQPWFSF